MDDHVHVGHRPGFGNVFLTVETKRSNFFLAGCVHLLVEDDLAFHQQSGRTAARIVNLHARFGIHDAGHYETHFGRRIEFSGAGNATFGKLADEILVAASDCTIRSR